MASSVTSSSSSGAKNQVSGDDTHLESRAWRLRKWLFSSDPIEQQRTDVSSETTAKEEISDVVKEVDNDTSSAETEYEFNADDIKEVVLVDDVTDMPANTLRMWVLAVVLSSVIAGVDAFFTLRFPSIAIGGIVAQLLAYPLGTLWHKIVPDFRIGTKSFGVSLNPGPFNIKEHTLIFMFANTVTSTRLVNITIAEQLKFFNFNYGVGRAILFNIASFMISWCWCGLSIPILVDNPDVVWPGILSSCALMKTLHSDENPYVPNWKISRLQYFSVIFVLSFVWYFFSDFIFPFIANIGAFLTWAVPTNAVVGQVFGTLNGLALLPISFDWSTISNISNPLTVPYVYGMSIFASFVFWVWIVIPGLYYRNHWQTAHFPIMTNAIFNTNGTSYLPAKVVNKKYELDIAKFKKYSPVMLPIGFLMTTALSLAAFSSMVVMIIYNFKDSVIQPLQRVKVDIHSQLILKYRRVPAIFYFVSGLIGLALGILFVEGWNRETQLDVGGFIVALVLGGLLYIPLCLIEAKSTVVISLQAFFNLVGAFWFHGKPMAVMYFMMFGFGTLQHAEHMSQGAKLGHYLKTPPLVTMLVLFAAGIWASLLNAGVTVFLLNHISDVCQTDAKNNMTCRTQRTSFNQHLVWGLFGDHIFAAGGRYSFILWFFLVGAVVALGVIALKKFYPQNKVVQCLNPTLLVSGAGKIPTSTGLQYGSWFAVILGFNYFIHKYKNAWWRKYNLVTAVGLDCGVAIAGILVFFCITYTGAGDHYSWWATNVVNTGCDANACAYLPKKTIKHPSGW